MRAEKQIEKNLTKKIKNLYIGDIANKLVYEKMKEDMPNFWDNDWNPHPILEAYEEEDNDDDWDDFDDEEIDIEFNDEEGEVEIENNAEIKEEEDFDESDDDFYRDMARDILIADKYYELYEQGNAIICEDLQNWIEYRLSVEYKDDEGIPTATFEENFMTIEFSFERCQDMIWRPSEFTKKRLAFERAHFLTRDLYPEREDDKLYYKLQLVIKDVNLQWNVEDEQCNGSLLLLLYDRSRENEWIVRLVFASYEKMGLTLLVQKFCDNKSEFDALFRQLNSIKKEEDSILEFAKKFATEYIKKEEQGQLKEEEYVHKGKLLENCKHI